MVMITPAEFEDKMRAIQRKNIDTETKLFEANRLMCDALRDNGYETGVGVFEEMEKWYS